MRHDSDLAEDQKSAEAYILDVAYDAIILDLHLPVAAGQDTLLQAGQNLIPFIRSSTPNARTPIIVISSQTDSTSLGADTIMLGASAFVPKNKTAVGSALFLEELQRKLEKALAQPPNPATPNATSAELIVHDGHIEFCGTRLRVDGLMRRILLLMCQAPQEILTAKNIIEKLDIDTDEGNIAKAVLKFRDKIIVALNKSGIIWDRDNIILNDRALGYRLAPRIAARDATQTAQHSPWNKRQLWILDALNQGRKLRRPDVMAEFDISEASAKRDLTGLVDACLIQFAGSSRFGHYEKTRSA
jgi:DNA-binding response OmpR family regulator